MRTANIEIGQTYLIRTVIAGNRFGPRRTPKQTVTRAAVVLEIVEGAVVVETTEPVCVNLTDFPPEQQAFAMANGQLRYEHRRTLHRVPPAGVLRVADPPPSAVVEDVALPLDPAGAA